MDTVDEKYLGRIVWLFAKRTIVSGATDRSCFFAGCFFKTHQCKRRLYGHGGWFYNWYTEADPRNNERQSFRRIVRFCYYELLIFLYCLICVLDSADGSSEPGFRKAR